VALRVTLRIYWNWELDWEQVPQAPIWNLELGFGGNGHIGLGYPIAGGYCVDDGPFANTTIPFVDSKNQPHCLARGFATGSKLEQLSQMFRPQALEELFKETSYNSFNLGLENGPHIAIPRIIQGDFEMLTAPSDPVFILHHAQLDRLWYKWQHADLANRITFYEGRAGKDNNDSASLSDVIPMGGLAPDITVAEIMSTEAGILCYEY